MALPKKPAGQCCHPSLLWEPAGRRVGLCPSCCSSQPHVELSELLVHLSSTGYTGMESLDLYVRLADRRIQKIFE